MTRHDLTQETNVSRAREIQTIRIAAQQSAHWRSGGSIGALAVGEIAIGRSAIGLPNPSPGHRRACLVRRLAVTEKLQLPPSPDSGDQPDGRCSAIYTWLSSVMNESGPSITQQADNTIASKARDKP